MDEYIVSARKYRPMTFDTVVGQAALTTTLKNVVKSGKLAHAYLFCGPRGVGKTTCARIFAKAINCQAPTEDGEACGKCESCLSQDEQRSYNVFELDAASNNSVDDVRSLIEQTRIPPQTGKYKVFIIDEVHMLSTAAFNAFLKTLEEPPAHVIFILATTEKHKVLPTIISRCQIYDFDRIGVPDIINQLTLIAQTEGVKYQEEALRVIAEKAEGGMRDALSMFDKIVSFCQGEVTYEKVIENLNVLDTESYFEIVDLCLENKIPELMSLFDGIISRGFDSGGVIVGLANHVRNIMLAKNDQTLKLLQVSAQQAQKFQLQASKCPLQFLYKALKIMNECDVNYRQSNNKRLLAELTLIAVAQLSSSDDDSEGSGPSPKQLKPIFNRQTIASSEEAPIAPSSSNVPESATKDVQKKVVSSLEENTIKLTDIGKKFSIRQTKTEDETPSLDDEPLISDDKKKPFDEKELLTQWALMCNRLQGELSVLSTRMKNLFPKITTYPNIEVVVDNGALLEEIKK
ncbi:MAG: DNA polymerase III subunit gamma/tau [Prevotella sp.]|nr:DNA polymerase III subunit gamma/tau [Prevotella sp.]